MNIYDFKPKADQKKIFTAEYLCSLHEAPKEETGIVHFRHQLGISQIELATRTGIPATSLCHYGQVGASYLQMLA